MYCMPIISIRGSLIFYEHKEMPAPGTDEQMIENTPYIRLVVNKPQRRETNEARPVKESPKISSTADSPSSAEIKGTGPENWSGPAHIVELVSQENRRAMEAQVPNAQEAEEALSDLVDSLPAKGQEVGDIHSHLDRRVILSLLAPLVSN